MEDSSLNFVADRNQPWERHLSIRRKAIEERLLANIRDKMPNGASKSIPEP
jgi:hypothetical protein